MTSVDCCYGQKVSGDGFGGGCWETYKKIYSSLLEECERKVFSAVCLNLCFLPDMFDKTRSGRLDLFGFSALWDYMQQWRALFQQYDRDRSGSISGAELHQGINVTSF